jgi:ribonuclease BN (tRNA processing enzyme)
MTHVTRFIVALVSFTFMSAFAIVAHANEFCGDSGVWVQIVGAGGPEIDDGQASSSYIVWSDNKARVIVDTGAGSSVGFDRSGADFADLEVIAFTHLHADHTVDFPAYVKGSYFLDRTEPLTVLGPDSSNPDFPDTETFIKRLIGPQGAYAYLADFLTFKSSGGYKISARNVPSTGNRRWARYGTETLRMSAIPVNHSVVPAIAWRVDIDDFSIVFTGDFNNQKNVIPEFAKNVDALVATHAIPETSRGTQRELHALPSQLGRIASQAQARMLILGHRMNRTLGRETQSREKIEEHYDGTILFANDMECWGL